MKFESTEKIESKKIVDGLGPLVLSICFALWVALADGVFPKSQNASKAQKDVLSWEPLNTNKQNVLSKTLPVNEKEFITSHLDSAKIRKKKSNIPLYER